MTPESCVLWDYHSKLLYQGCITYWAPRLAHRRSQLNRCRRRQQAQPCPTTGLQKRWDHCLRRLKQLHLPIALGTSGEIRFLLPATTALKCNLQNQESWLAPVTRTHYSDAEQRPNRTGLHYQLEIMCSHDFLVTAVLAGVHRHMKEAALSPTDLRLLVHIKE